LQKTLDGGGIVYNWEYLQLERKRKMKLKRTESGRSIVEMLGVLAIMGVITVMGISGYSQAVGRLNRNKVQEDITRYAQEVRTLYAGRGMFSSGTTALTATELKSNIMAIMGISTMPSPYGGEYAFVVGANGGYFGIQVPNIASTDAAYFGNIVWQGARMQNGGAQASGAEKPYFVAGTTCTAVATTGTASTIPAFAAGTNYCMTLFYN
jgi:type II secretory pathway pseudopilin PulG